jgi:hypothetical protein
METAYFDSAKLIRTIVAYLTVFGMYAVDVWLMAKHWSVGKWVFVVSIVLIYLLKFCLLDLGKRSLYNLAHRLIYMLYIAVAPLSVLVIPHDIQQRKFTHSKCDNCVEPNIRYTNYLAAVELAYADIHPALGSEQDDVLKVSYQQGSRIYYEGVTIADIWDLQQYVFGTQKSIDEYPSIVDSVSFLERFTIHYAIDTVAKLQVTLLVPNDATGTDLPIVCFRATATVHDALVDLSMNPSTSSIGCHSGVLNTWLGYKQLLSNWSVFDRTDPFVLVGFSLGGGISQLCVLDGEFNVRRCVLMASMTTFTNWVLSLPVFEDAIPTIVETHVNIFDFAPISPPFPYCKIQTQNEIMNTCQYHRVNSEFGFMGYLLRCISFPIQILTYVINADFVNLVKYHSSDIGYGAVPTPPNGPNMTFENQLRHFPDHDFVPYLITGYLVYIVCRQRFGFGSGNISLLCGLSFAIMYLLSYVVKSFVPQSLVPQSFVPQSFVPQSFVPQSFVVTEQLSLLVFAAASVILTRQRVAIVTDPCWWLIVCYYLSYVIFVYQQYRASVTSPDSRTLNTKSTSQ